MSTPEQQTVFDHQIETIVSMLEQGMFAGREAEVLEQLSVLKLQLGALATAPETASDEDPVVEDFAPNDSYKTDAVRWRPPAPEPKESASSYSDASPRPSVKKITAKDDAPSSPTMLYRFGHEYRSWDGIGKPLAGSEEVSENQERDAQSVKPADWRHNAACREVEPELFFPINEIGFRGQVERAISVCSRCIVIDDCLNWAMKEGEAYGIWGGTTEEERRAMRYEQITDRAV